MNGRTSITPCMVNMAISRTYHIRLHSAVAVAVAEALSLTRLAELIRDAAAAAIFPQIALSTPRWSAIPRPPFFHFCIVSLLGPVLIVIFTITYKGFLRHNRLFVGIPHGQTANTHGVMRDELAADRLWAWIKIRVNREIAHCSRPECYNYNVTSVSVWFHFYTSIAHYCCTAKSS